MADIPRLPKDSDHKEGVTFFLMHELLFPQSRLEEFMTSFAAQWAKESQFVTRMGCRRVDRATYWVMFNTNAFEPLLERLVRQRWDTNGVAQALIAAGYKIRVYRETPDGPYKLRFSPGVPKPGGDPRHPTFETPKLPSILEPDQAARLYEEAELLRERCRRAQERDRGGMVSTFKTARQGLGFRGTRTRKGGDGDSTPRDSAPALKDALSSGAAALGRLRHLRRPRRQQPEQPGGEQ